MKARIFTLLSAMVIFIGPIYSQNDWWEELDLPMDTIYVANCEDIENVINTQYLNEVFNHWIFPENAEHENIVGNHKNQFTFDQGSNCIGAEWAITLLNWDNLEQYEYDRIFKIEPSLPGPCGMHFTYDEHKAEAGISIADLDHTTGLRYEVCILYSCKKRRSSSTDKSCVICIFSTFTHPVFKGKTNSIQAFLPNFC